MVVALVMYSLLPIVGNTIVGLREVDPAIVESAQGMGMSRGQRLWRIELPLAWPVILTGMRVSTLITLGIAAIGAYINGPGLGNEIFAGPLGQQPQRAQPGARRHARRVVARDPVRPALRPDHRLTTSRGIR